MRRVPRRRIRAAALAIVMADLGAAAALGAVGPVAARRGRGGAVKVAAGQDVVTVRRIAAAVAPDGIFVADPRNRCSYFAAKQ